MFSTRENASKRYEDTGVLIGEFLVHDPREERARKAIARMNYLHSPYIKGNKISNADLLYTLSVFLTEPISWINRYEWRKVTDMEICAFGTFWKSIGDAMEITYSGYLKRDSWKDGIEFYEDIKEWAEQYETEHMVPAATNKKTADELVPLLLFYIPGFLHPLSRQAVGVLMGGRLRHAMMWVVLLFVFCYDSNIVQVRGTLSSELYHDAFSPVLETVYPTPFEPTTDLARARVYEQGSANGPLPSQPVSCPSVLCPAVSLESVGSNGVVDVDLRRDAARGERWRGLYAGRLPV